MKYTSIDIRKKSQKIRQNIQNLNTRYRLALLDRKNIDSKKNLKRKNITSHLNIQKKLNSLHQRNNTTHNLDDNLISLNKQLCGIKELDTNNHQTKHDLTISVDNNLIKDDSIAVITLLVSLENNQLVKDLVTKLLDQELILYAQVSSNFISFSKKDNDIDYSSQYYLLMHAKKSKINLIIDFFKNNNYKPSNFTALEGKIINF